MKKKTIKMGMLSLVLACLLICLTGCPSSSGTSSSSKKTSSSTSKSNTSSSINNNTSSTSKSNTSSSINNNTGSASNKGKGSSGSFTNAYGTPTTKCAHAGCNNYIASSGDTNCCTTHSHKCKECGKYIDEDATWCMSCIKKALQ